MEPSVGTNTNGEKGMGQQDRRFRGAGAKDSWVMETSGSNEWSLVFPREQGRMGLGRGGQPLLEKDTK